MSRRVAPKAYTKDEKGRYIKVMDKVPSAHEGVPFPPKELEGCEVMWEISAKRWIFYDPKDRKAYMTAAAAFQKYGGEIRVLVPAWEFL